VSLAESLCVNLILEKIKLWSFNKITEFAAIPNTHCVFG